MESFTVLCGIPDAGKEEAAKKYIKNPSQTVYIRTNNIREEIGLKPEENEDKVFESAYSRIRQALKDRKDVIYIATNLDCNTREKVLSLAAGIPGIKKTLAVVCRDPAKTVSDVPKQKLEAAAEILAENKPNKEEGWDQIDIWGNEPECGRGLQDVSQQVNHEFSQSC